MQLLIHWRKNGFDKEKKKRDYALSLPSRQQSGETLATEVQLHRHHEQVNDKTSVKEPSHQADDFQKDGAP